MHISAPDYVSVVSVDSGGCPTLLPQQWARPGLDVDADALLGSVEQGLGVRLIATPRDTFVTCKAETPLLSVVQNNKVERFDFLPVMREFEQVDRIVGLLHLAPFLTNNSEPVGMVAEHMQPLSEENLIGADAGILNFVRDADRRPCRLVISSTQIIGLVSLSDLQRLPVRPVLFMLITHLELLMTDVIRAEFETRDAWMMRLSDTRRAEFNRRLNGRRRSDMEVNPLLMTEFCDKATIIAKRSDLPCSRGEFGRAMKAAQALRDDVAHANDFAATPDTARNTCAVVRTIEEWIGRLKRPPFRSDRKATP